MFAVVGVHAVEAEFMVDFSDSGVGLVRLHVVCSVTSLKVSRIQDILV